MTKKNHYVEEGFRKRRNRFITVTFLLAVFVLMLSIAMLYLGNTRYSLSVIVRVLMGEQIQGASFSIRT